MLALRDDDPVRVADYRLLGRLGEGGMGVVYLARSPRGRMVAVKSVRAELAALPDFRLRFAEEVSIARRVGGDWTAEVLDADPQAERPWVATAYVPGPTLGEVVARHGPLPERSVRGLASGLCDALADIHGAGLVHRDLKPSNIMVTVNGPKVIDFGIVRALDGPTHGGLTSSGVIVGSPGFMAPEQVRGERLTAACDIFALGSVLAFAACGRLPFDVSGCGPHALMYRVVHEEADLTGVPAPLLPLIRDCLAKDPAVRPSLTTLREREETRFRHLGPWLPAPVLARLGQDAARLLDHEDPRTGLAALRVPPAPPVPPQAPPPRAEAPPPAPAAAPAAPATAPLTVPDAPRQPPGAAAATPSGGTPPGATPSDATPPGATPSDATPPGATPAGGTASGGTPEEGTPAGGTPGAAPRTRTLAEERNGSNGAHPSTVAVHITLTLHTLVALGATITQLNLDGTSVEYSSDINDDVAYVWGGIQTGTAVALMVAWLFWCARVRAVAEGFAPGRLRYSRSAAVWSWFVPLGNLFLPKQIADDVWHASSPPAPGGAMAPAARLHIWWGLWVTSAVTAPAFWYWGAYEWADSDSLTYHSVGECCSDPNYDSWYSYGLEGPALLGLVLRLLIVPTAVATALYVARLTALQKARLAAA